MGYFWSLPLLAPFKYQETFLLSLPFAFSPRRVHFPLPVSSEVEWGTEMQGRNAMLSGKRGICTLVNPPRLTSDGTELTEVMTIYRALAMCQVLLRLPISLNPHKNPWGKYDYYPWPLQAKLVPLILSYNVLWFSLGAHTSVWELCMSPLWECKLNNVRSYVCSLWMSRPHTRHDKWQAPRKALLNKWILTKYGEMKAQRA